MAERIFREMIQAKWDEKKFVCVGLDSDSNKIPEAIKKERSAAADQVLSFNVEIINATCDLACAFKPNIAFYESLGVFGAIALGATVDYIKLQVPDVPIIGDVKRGDINNTNFGYVKAAFECFGFDAITVHNYLGKKAMQPFLDQKDKGIFVLCRTSNKGAGEFQDPLVVVGDRFVPFYQYVAHRVATDWNQNGNCGLVVGATYPEELAIVRSIVGDDMPILIPGVGNQGGDLEKTVKAAKKNMIINASRSVIFASSGSDFAKAARKAAVELQEAIKRYL